MLFISKYLTAFPPFFMQLNDNIFMINNFFKTKSQAAKNVIKQEVQIKITKKQEQHFLVINCTIFCRILTFFHFINDFFFVIHCLSDENPLHPTIFLISMIFLQKLQRLYFTHKEKLFCFLHPPRHQDFICNVKYINYECYEKLN